MLLPGARVVVRTAAEIAASLDQQGALDGLPFMPEMLAWCGQPFTVAMRAERACVRGIGPGERALRQLDGCVALEGLRCDGSAHGGCQLGCAVLWKEAWLRATDGADAVQVTPLTPPAALPLRTSGGSPPRYVCQATELVRASRPGQGRWEPGPYLRLVRVGALSWRALLGVVSWSARFRLARRWVALRRRRGAAAPAQEVLGVQPGDWVEVRSATEILATLDAGGRHRGLGFSADMTALCGRTLRVRARVRSLIQEETGSLRAVRDTVILEGADCRRHLGCARQMPFLWREAWLRRAGAAAEPVQGANRGGYRLAKRAMDVVAAALALLLLSPLLAAIALAVPLSSPGPALFRQVRVGRGGRPFTLLKFRSMAVGQAGPAVTARGDPRVTRVGALLRRSRLDELPQLWNVLVGDMSLVGPRPELLRYVELFPAEYRRILTVRPGLTDLATLAFLDEESLLARTPAPETAYAEVVLPAKIALSQRYLEQMSLRTDVKLLLRTLESLLP